MIYFNITVRNPAWCDRWANIKNWAGNTPIKNKHWEVQITKCEELFRIEFQWSFKQDHAGIRLELGLLGYKIDFTLYDSRHWDYKNNRWEQHGS